MTNTVCFANTVTVLRYNSPSSGCSGDESATLSVDWKRRRVRLWFSRYCSASRSGQSQRSTQKSNQGKNGVIGKTHGMNDCTDTGNGRKEGRFLFNAALKIFYLRLYGIKHMVKDHSDSERENLLLFPISSKGSFIYTIPQTG